MVCRDEIIRKLDPEDRRFIDRAQLIVACLFLAIYIAIIVWGLTSPRDAADEARPRPAGTTESATMHASVKDAPQGP
ncbi:MAG TPA: hypothetical protein VGL96_02835 [Casimicrobiaceae bacterium]